jgi:hypothetical protein
MSSFSLNHRSRLRLGRFTSQHTQLQSLESDSRRLARISFEDPRNKPDHRLITPLRQLKRKQTTSEVQPVSNNDLQLTLIVLKCTSGSPKDA